MSVNSDNELKWEIGTSEPLTIMDAGTEETPFGSKYVVHIKPLITGQDHFMPSPGLKKKIEEINVDVGDVITVEKVAPSDKYQYGYFSVSVVDKGKGPQIAKDRIEKSPVGAGFAQKDAKVEMDSYAIGETKAVQPAKDMALHELTLRVEKLEKIVATLWTDYSNRTSDAGHKVGDEQLPF